MTESASGKMIALTHLKRFGIWLAIVLPVFLCAEALRWAVVWGQRGDPVLHYWMAAIAALAIAFLFNVFELIVAWFPNVAWLARLHVPRWTAFEPFFKSSKIPLTIVFLSYLLFYVTQGVDEETRWAIWVNKHVFNFDLFCRHFSAIDTIRIEIVGYVLYLALHGIYNYFCPPILAHSIRKSGGLAREDAALVLVQTIERHGQAIPQSDLAKTIYGFADENRGLLDEESRKVLDERLKLLDQFANPPPDEPPPGEPGSKVGDSSSAVAMAAAGDAAAVARLFPSERATETYYLGVDLFDILYPPVRFLLCVGLVAAILATSLPVAAKLLWVAFPRLGEACMTDLNQVPVDFRDSEWVEFEGAVQTAGPDTSVLVPADDANERWTLKNKNVTVANGEKEQRIFLRIGSVVEIDTIGMGASTAPPFSPAPNARMSKQCSPAGSRCSNHVEICCGSNVIKGKCYGRWPCPKQP
ncbi:hypothetical protein EOW77_0034330 [Bradyrhizobium yuanmingense]|uniref:hypothetical protein n=1 Tax=Bradyrhizobium yuanmingense TaxID=108015 RepID=UPI000FE3002B|nr:hypothetical protein [Bradyrhizobium yuanmingense]TGN74176.1 hypothetical protein EOW77_0034330 [Bradyrhizobium yuanmingense]